MRYLSNFLLRFYPLRLSLTHSGIPVFQGTPVKRLIASCFPGPSGEDACPSTPVLIENTAAASRDHVAGPKPESHFGRNSGESRWKRTPKRFSGDPDV